MGHRPILAETCLGCLAVRLDAAPFEFRDSLEDLFRIMLGTSLHWPEPSLSAKRTEQRPRPTVALPPSCIAACFFSVSRTTSKTSSSLLTLTLVATSSPDRTVSAGKDSSYQSPPLCTVFVSDN